MDGVQHYFMLFCLWLIPTLLFQYLLKKPTKPRLSLPPSPPSLPLIGHLHHLGKDVIKGLQNLSSKYGPILYLRFGFQPLILISSSSLVAEIFKTNDVIFSSRTKPPFDDNLLFADSGFFCSPYGDYWRFMKKLCVTELLGARHVERSRHVRHEELMQFMHKMVEKARRSEVVDVLGELMKLTNNTICRMAMSTRCSEEDGEAEQVRKLMKEISDLIEKMGIAFSLGPFKKLVYWMYGKQLMDVQRRCDELLEKILKEHEARAKVVADDCGGGERKDKDLMDILLKAYQDDKAEFKITRSNIKAFIQDIFVASTNSLSNLLQWTMAELINNPNIFKKLREEIESVVGTSRVVQESDIPKLQYLNAVVKELLRLHLSTSLISRVCGEDCQIGGYDVPKNMRIAIDAYAIMRNPEIWENPNEFRPERWLMEYCSKEQDVVMNKIKGQNFNFLPFGGGRRSCPGANLAVSIMSSAVAAMVQCFDWRVDCGNYEDGMTNNKVNMQARAGVSVRMAHLLLCRPVIHFNPFEA